MQSEFRLADGCGKNGREWEVLRTNRLDSMTHLIIPLNELEAAPRTQTINLMEANAELATFSLMAIFTNYNLRSGTKF